MLKISYVLFGNHSGYGIAGQDYLNALLQTHLYDIRVDIVGKQISKPGVSDKRFSLLTELSKKEDSEEHIQMFHCVPPLQSKFKHHLRSVGFATFETFNPPGEWINILNKNDAMIAPSLFNYKVFAHMLIKKPIFHIPHCLDFNVFRPNVIPSRQYDKFTFLFFGSWKLRKGNQQLLEAWFSEFDINDNVQLIIKTDKAEIAKSETDRAKNNLGYKRKETAPILFENKVFDEDEIPGFLKSVDCLISPHIGEGFGLCGIQCMGVGVPIIITNFSGCQDYATEDTATLLEPRGFIMHECLDHYPQMRHRKFAFVSVQDIAEKMRFVFNNYEQCQKKAEFASGHVADNFNYSRIASMFGEMFNMVYGEKL